MTCLDVVIQVWSNKCHWTSRSDLHIHIGLIHLVLKCHLLQGPPVRTCVDPERSRFCPPTCLAALLTLLSHVSDVSDVSASSCSAMDSLGSRGRASVMCVGKSLMASSVPDHCTAPLLNILPVTEMSENERQVPSRTVLLFILTQGPLRSTVVPRSRLAGPCKARSPGKK